jgi:hypothetical protein
LISDRFVEIMNGFVERLWMLDIKRKVGDFAEPGFAIVVERA